MGKLGAQCGCALGVYCQFPADLTEHNAVVLLSCASADVAGNDIGENGTWLALQRNTPARAAPAADQDSISGPKLGFMFSAL